ncbi:hypothetical protein ELQ87_04585 [Streptomyces griseoviridis]|uniref:Uncharacterized protein n=1 Tax=Streptomyces griseoviridis TaxID=45398 RepID=A0A3Q9KSN0_STRGD|nr:hypothetical protein ELQ87_04585 [Streptomyces griseoviridis]
MHDPFVVADLETRPPQPRPARPGEQRRPLPREDSGHGMLFHTFEGRLGGAAEGERSAAVCGPGGDRRRRARAASQKPGHKERQGVLPLLAILKI